MYNIICIRHGQRIDEFEDDTDDITDTVRRIYSLREKHNFLMF